MPADQAANLHKLKSIPKGSQNRHHDVQQVLNFAMLSNLRTLEAKGHSEGDIPMQQKPMGACNTIHTGVPAVGLPSGAAQQQTADPGTAPYAGLALSDAAFQQLPGPPGAALPPLHTMPCLSQPASHSHWADMQATNTALTCMHACIHTGNQHALAADPTILQHVLAACKCPMLACVDHRHLWENQCPTHLGQAWTRSGSSGKS